MNVILGLFLAFATYTVAQQTAELQVLQGNGQFTNSLYKVLSEKEGENVFFSPLSAHAVLSLAYQGAQGTTAEAFGSTLHVSKAKAAAEGYSQVMERLNNVQNVTLLIANKAFVKEGKNLLPEFKTTAVQDFKSEVQSLDFAQNEAAAKTINSWVEEKTHDKIKDLINKDDLDGLTQLVLVNAIYFKGNWAQKFDKAATKKAPFYLNDHDTVQVDMMNTKNSFNYKFDKNLDAQILELPYTNKDLSLVVILPSKKDGIKELEQKLQNVDLTTITQGLYSTDVIVQLPKFKIETKIDLKDALEKLGLGIIFDKEKANFRGILPVASDENLYVSKVVQKAFIEVNEEGAEAAAATAVITSVVLSAISRDPVPERFRADHPFLFIVTQSEKTLSNRADESADVVTLFRGKVAKL